MLSRLALERYAHGEASEPPSSEELPRLEELERADLDFLAAHPPAAFFDDVRRKRRRRALRRWAALAPALAASFAFAIVGLPALARLGGERTKGGELNIFAYHKTDGGNEILDPNTALSAGEEIQIAYYASGRAYAAILSIDGRGTITRHMPLHGQDALQIDTKDFALLPYSYRLDDAPSFEEIYFVISPRPFKVDFLPPFLKAGFDHNTSELQLPRPFSYAALLIKKAEAAK